MQTVSPSLISGKTVLLRMDLDVPLKKISPQASPTEVTLEDTTKKDSETQVTVNLAVAEDYRLKAGLETLKLCLEHAKSVIVMGHLGRPNGTVDPELSVAPIVDWLEQQFEGQEFPEGKLHVLENLRFEPGEDSCDLNYAKQLASLGDFFVNESFSAHHPAASTTLLPTLLPHAAGLRFAKEVEVLSAVLNNPQKPLVAIIGGAKIEDKMSVVNQLSKIADAVLIGGKLISEIREKGMGLPSNVMVGAPNEQGFDIAPESRLSFQGVISRSKQVIWSGPMGKFEDGFNDGNKAVAEAIVVSGADSIVGGGDTIAALDKIGMLDKMKFVSVGGGAMLKFLADGTLPTILALE